MSRNEWVAAYFAGMIGIFLIVIGEILNVARPDFYWNTPIKTLGGLIFLASGIYGVLRYTFLKGENNDKTGNR